MTCTGCKADLGDFQKRRTYLCISTQGDERVMSWWLCEACGVYTMEEYVDRFVGESYANVFGPLSREESDDAVERIARCPRRNDKWCACETHKHFGSDM